MWSRNSSRNLFGWTARKVGNIGISEKSSVCFLGIFINMLVRKSMCPYYGVGVSQNWGALIGQPTWHHKRMKQWRHRPEYGYTKQGPEKSVTQRFRPFCPVMKKMSWKEPFSPTKKHHRQLRVSSKAPLPPTLEKLQEKSRKNWFLFWESFIRIEYYIK